MPVYRSNFTGKDVDAAMQFFLAALNGEDGTGLGWLSGSGAPDNGIGSDGCFYLNTSTYDVHKKTSGAWGDAIANLKGLTGNPYKAYATLAAANADLANIPADALIWVNADPTAANIGYWAKIGGVLVQSSYDRVAAVEKTLEAFPAGSDAPYQIIRSLINEGTVSLGTVIQKTGDYLSDASPISVVAGYAFACLAPTQKFNIVRIYVTTENPTVPVRLSIKDSSMVTLAKAIAVVRKSGWQTLVLSREIDPSTLSDGIYYVAIESVGHAFRIYRANFSVSNGVLADTATYANKYTRTSDADSNIWFDTAGTAYQGLIETYHTDNLSSLNIAGFSLLLEDLTTDYAQDANCDDAYINLSGAQINSTTWKTTPFIPVYPGMSILFTGYGSASQVSSVSIWDENKQFLGTVYTHTGVFSDVVVTIQDQNAKYFRASSAKSYPFVFNVTRPVLNERMFARLEDILADISALQTDMGVGSVFAPDQAYALQGEAIFLNARGILANRAVSLAWNLSQGNEEVCQIIPTSTDPISVKLAAYKNSGRLVIADFNVLVTGTPISPTTPQNFICLGDSLTLGVNSISGAYVNELSRRLTGVGTALLSGEQSPVALSLSNIYFRGTVGDQPIKHEGRAGWSAATYLTYASLSGINNSFWNPGTNQFDLNYYLATYGFDIGSDPTNGVLADGSNLTMIILLGWNDVYKSTPTASAVNLGLLIDRIQTAKPNVKTIVLGLNPAPKINFKSFTGERYVSEREVFELAIKQFGEAYKSLARSKINTDFLQLSHVFIPEVAYPTTSKVVSSRSTTTLVGASDHVHPSAVGYAQIADALFYKILYDYCR